MGFRGQKWNHRAIVSFVWLCAAQHKAQAQEAFRTSFSSISPISESRLVAAWWQIASGVERPRPLQLQPVMGLAYTLNPVWRAGVSYDFQSLAFEVTHAFSSEGSSREYGLAIGLLPELRSFSWRLGPWLSWPLWRGRLALSVSIASVNAWGYGLWASEVKASHSGRSFLIPARVDYAFDLGDGLNVQAGLAAQWGLPGVMSSNRYTASVGIAKDFK